MTQICHTPKTRLAGGSLEQHGGPGVLLELHRWNILAQISLALRFTTVQFLLIPSSSISSHLLLRIHQLVWVCLSD